MKTNVALVLALVLAASSSAITVPTVPVGNPGNPADMPFGSSDIAHPNGIGAVAQSFNIGTTEVTNAQYVAFLNAVAKSDPYGLYNVGMGSDIVGGIVRAGVDGSYSYSVKATALNGAYSYENKPVVHVNWGRAARFANWLSNGQPTGADNASTTEDGAYTLYSASVFDGVKRNPGAHWWLPSENEWYKSAYYNSSTATYYKYATRTDTVPNNNVPANDSGNSANFFLATGNGSFPLTDAGAYLSSYSPYGTFDQAGNVWEWTETILEVNTPNTRVVKGGSWNWDASNLGALGLYQPTNEGYDLGFRVATSFVPEPSTFVLAVIATGSIWLCRKRFVLTFSNASLSSSDRV